MDCKWGEWTFWSRCTCRNMEKTKTRRKKRKAQNGGQECEGSSFKTESCDPDHCPGNVIKIKLQTVNLV